MDIFSHGIWSGIAASAINKKIKKPLNVWRAAFWGVFPDLFAFIIPFVGLFWYRVIGVDVIAPSPSEAEPPAGNNSWIFRLAGFLYPFSHSLIVFLLVFALVFLICRRPVWEMGAWLFHIFIDIPTHSYRFYPTPFLWPVSGWKFNGFSWGEPWFVILNYSLILFAYFIFRRR